MFKVADLRSKILFTLLIVAIYRLGAHIPVPGVNFDGIQQLKSESNKGGVLGFLNLFSGGALTSFAVFALGIMPYITSSIIMQILTVVVPKLEQWQEQGAVGQRKMTQATRYLTIAIAIMQSTGLAFLFHNGGGGLFGRGSSLRGIDLIPRFNAPRVLLIVVTLTVGTAVLMWMGELISQRGIGNGMSILIFSSVVSTLPYEYEAVRVQKGWPIFFGLILMSIAILVGIIIVEQGQRRIPVQFAKRQVGRRVYGGQSTYIPLKVNQSGVVPIIFASSVLQLPALLATTLQVGWLQTFANNHLVRSSDWLYNVIFGLMIVGFAYFYTAITFDPIKQADNLRKQGGFVPGIRPGVQTEKFFQKVLSRLTLPGALFIAMIALIPNLFLGVLNVQRFPFGGTSILIAVGVALETMKQIDSQLMMRNYEGFLK